jgi:hypothetical protein
MSQLTKEFDKCPKCGGDVTVLERSGNFWGGVDCVAVEKDSAHNIAMVQCKLYDLGKGCPIGLKYCEKAGPCILSRQA